MIVFIFFVPIGIRFAVTGRTGLCLQTITGFERTHRRSRWKNVLDDEIKWLNMNLKPDKECEKGGDIVLLSEIMANTI